jgi:hypothetical protein
MLGLYIGFCSSLIVLIGNSAILAVALQSQQSASGSMRALVEDGPDRTHVLSTVYHILINFCSTILLSSSKYAMQILSAPTRDEIDQPHVDGGWLEIGTMSLHNLWHIRRTRTVLWLLFTVSSLPLHLLQVKLRLKVLALTQHGYNSAILERDQRARLRIRLSCIRIIADVLNRQA